jgi:hypothetical protein
MTSEREVLMDQVLDQMVQDVNNKDFTAIYELLMQLPDETLIAYLPEEMQ